MFEGFEKAQGLTHSVSVGMDIQEQELHVFKPSNASTCNQVWEQGLEMAFQFVCVCMCVCTHTKW